MKTPHPGFILLLILVFGSVFFIVLMGLAGLVLAQNRALDVGRSRTEAFSIAEAGLEYYRWFLSHYPGDTTHGTGLPGPYEIAYEDPEGGTAGTYTLSIDTAASCGQTSWVAVSSTGAPSDAPTATKTLVARYAQPSVAQFSFITNSSVWIASTLFGPFHSNGGIRMDGISTSPVTSSVQSWTCDGSFGCSPSQSKPGVWGSGVDQSLWEYPTPQLDFAGIASDFASLETIAQSDGIHFSRYSSGNGGNSYYKGYHLVFNSNGTVTVYKVGSENTVQAVPVSNPGGGFQTEYTLIKNETLDGTYVIPEDCPLIYIEDHAWVEGSIDDKVTLVVADIEHAGVTPHTLLKGNITYTSYDGSAGLTLISEGNVLIAPNAPTNLTLNGIFISQLGAFGFNRYTCASGYATKNSLTILGTIVSALRPGTAYGTTCGGTPVGFANRVTAFDRQLSVAPPAFTPVTSVQYQFVDWREQ